MNNLRNTTKIVLFASLIAAMILPFSAMNMAYADDSIKTDTELIREAEIIMQTEKNFDYDGEANNENGIQNEDQRRHQEIIKELNQRGMFHESQTRDESMAGYVVTNTQSTNTDGTPIEVTMLSPIQNDAEVMDRVCCGTAHDKKLSVRSGMEWHNSVFSWITHREVGNWSPFSSTQEFSTAEITGSEKNVKLYVHTKNDHPITTAALSITSELQVKDRHGNYVTMQPATIKAYNLVYYPIINTLKGNTLYTEPTLPAHTQHKVTMNIYSIS